MAIQTKIFEVDPKDVKALQDAFNEKSALMELINNKVMHDEVMARYYAAHNKFTETSEAIINKVAPEIDIVLDAPDWNMDFNEKKIHLTWNKKKKK